MKHAVIKYFLFLSLIVLSACSTPFLYMPNTLNMPLAGNKNEIKANLYYGADGPGLQGSYCIDSQIVVIGNVSHLSENNPFQGEFGSASNISTYIKNDLVDIGGGRFSKFGKYGRFELLGGTGIGITNSLNANANFGDFFPPQQQTATRINGQFLHFFAQADIGMVNRNIEFGFGLRASSISITGKFYQYQIDSSNNLKLTTEQNLIGTAVFLQPCLMLAVGAENVKLHLSFGGSGKIYGPDFSNVASSFNSGFGSIYQPFFIAAGVTVNLFRDL